MNTSLVPKKWWPKVLLMSVVVLSVLTIGSIGAIRYTYQNNLRAVSNSQEIKLVTIPSGSSVRQIGDLLKRQHLIRQTWAFEWYVRNNDLRDKLQAGTYAVRPSQDIPHIVSTLAQGKIATDLVTVLPGQRLDQIRVALINYGFAPSEVDKALDPQMHANHPALVDKPPEASLEGYLYPESFQHTAATTASDIVEASLHEMQKRYTPELRTAITAQGLTPHQGIILASIVEKEVSNAADRPIVAQVFLNRLHMGMQLGSDVTALYGAVKDGKAPSLSYDSPYNTHLHTGLPPGPISNVSTNSLAAVAHPSGADFIYFVSGDDGKTYFGRTLDEHQANIKNHCKRLCSQNN